MSFDFMSQVTCLFKTPSGLTTLQAAMGESHASGAMNAIFEQ